MSDQISKPGRGRPRRITRERIADAGIALGLTELTFVGVAQEIGVTQMALYKHVSNLDALRRLVAEEAFLRWSLPDPVEDLNLEAHLHRLSLSLWALVYRHAGVAPYLLRRDLITEAMMDRIQAHQLRVAARFDLAFEQANQIVFTVAYHCCAIADASRAETPDATEIEPLHGFGIQALIEGVIALSKPSVR